MLLYGYLLSEAFHSRECMVALMGIKPSSVTQLTELEDQKLWERGDQAFWFTCVFVEN